MDAIGVTTVVVVLLAGLLLGLWHRWSSGRLRDVAPDDPPPVYRRRTGTSVAGTAAAASMNAAAVAASTVVPPEPARPQLHVVRDEEAAPDRRIDAPGRDGEIVPDREEEPAVIEGTRDRSAARESLDPALLADLGVGPAEATLLQFSSAFCAPCRAVRRVSSEVAALLPGVQHIEVDAESHLDAVRALGIWRTPTLLILDSTGRVTKRATGVPAKPQLIAALGEVLPSRD